MAHVNRIFIGVNNDKKSAIVYWNSSNHQEMPQISWRSTLWATTELPVNNQIETDRGSDVTAREPEGNGLTFRALEIPRDTKDANKHVEILKDLNKKVKQKYHPRKRISRDTPACIGQTPWTCSRWPTREIHLVTDTDDTLLKPGDTAVVQGVNHAWSNQSDKPCMIIGVMVHANPWPKDQYPAEGL